MAVETVDVDAMTAEDFAALVKRSSDSDLAATFAQAGEERVLERVFSTIPERLKASAAASVNDTMSFRITSGDTTYSHGLRIANGTCTHISGPVEEFRAGVSCDIVTFSKLLTGQASEITLFLRRKLKIAGDLAFAQGFLRYFDRPKA
jgi:alkyl sulfatase BDS1-like metallo-beta-lactamase superfamily hydrolase